MRVFLMMVAWLLLIAGTLMAIGGGVGVLTVAKTSTAAPPVLVVGVSLSVWLLVSGVVLGVLGAWIRQTVIISEQLDFIEQLQTRTEQRIYQLSQQIGQVGKK